MICLNEMQQKLITFTFMENFLKAIQHDYLCIIDILYIQCLQIDWHFASFQHFLVFQGHMKEMERVMGSVDRGLWYNDYQWEDADDCDGENINKINYGSVLGILGFLENAKLVLIFIHLSIM